MSKRVAFIVLVVLAVGFAVLARRWQSDFLSDLWSQLFWLTLGTLATTFVLDAILERAAHVCQRSRDAFAFRTFSATMLDALHGIVGLQPKDERLFEAALSGDKPFEAAAKNVASLIEESAIFEPSIYLKYYLDVAGGLRDLSKNYIRIEKSTNSPIIGTTRMNSQNALGSTPPRWRPATRTDWPMKHHSKINSHPPKFWS